MARERKVSRKCLTQPLRLDFLSVILYYRSMEQTKKCLYCKSTFTKPITESKKNWFERHKYCSKSCLSRYTYSQKLEAYKYKKGQAATGTPFTKGQTAGENNNNWKGGTATYQAKHMWVKYHYGRPSECQHCGTTDKRMYHWANISKEFKRDKNDWLRLCVPCHKRYDLDRNIK